MPERKILINPDNKKSYSISSECASIAENIGFQIGNSLEMLKLVSKACKVAKKNVNVLIQGETGTGKEVLARFIHAASNRSNNIFIPVNCGALPENLLESELFGHEKGSFTGAANLRKGIFELANGGTLFLDEVGESSLSIQVKLLRVLETGEFSRIGGEKLVKTDVRVVAATNRDLEESIKDKSFREDLFYRLDVARLELPPLRERRNDIPLLAKYFVKKLNPDLGISKDTMNILCNYPWPGNIRELANTISQAAALCDEEHILPEYLNKRLLSFASAANNLPQGLSPSPILRKEMSNSLFKSLEEILGQVLTENLLDSIDKNKLVNLMKLLRKLESKLAVIMKNKDIDNKAIISLESIEADAIRGALDVYRGNITMAAKALGIGRNTLYRKLKEYDVKKAE